MTTISVTTIQAKEEFSELIHRVAHNKEHIFLTRRDKEIAAIIPWDDWLLLRDLLSKSDLHESLEALKEARTAGTMTLDQLKVKIG